MAFTTNDNAPYLYRKSGGGGDKEIDKLVGGTIAWNQIVRNGNFASTSDWTASSDSSFTASNNVATFRAGAQYRSLTQSTPTGDKIPKLNHVYMGIIKAKSYTNTNTFFYVRSVLSSVLQSATKTLSTTEKEYVNVLKINQEANYLQFMVQDNNTSGFGDITVQNARFFDLTLTFGSTIADYVYSLEQSSQGSGLAWLRSYGFFTEDYYDYNSGELKSVSNLVSHDMTGKNLCSQTGVNNAVIGQAKKGMTYTFSIRNQGSCGCNIKKNNNSGATIATTDGEHPTDAVIPVTFTADEDCNLFLNGYGMDGYTFLGSAYDYQLELGSTATSYEPYTLHSYPLGDVTLRGLPKLNGNALYYDGDTYESNGTVTRKYGVVDLGTLSWSYSSTANHERMQTTGLASVIKSSTSTSRLANILCSAYKTITADGTYNHGEGIGIAVSVNGTVFVYDTAYTDAASFKTAMSGVYLVYELASSTTETADTYTNPQWVNPNGTEKYTLSTNAFPMPVGHETTYNTDIGSKTVNTQVNLSMTEPQVRQVYAKEGDTARVLNIHLDQTEEDGTLRILRPDGTEVTADAVLVPEFYNGLMAEIPSDATEIVGKCYCDVEQNGVSSMPFTLNVKKNERAT